MKNKGLAIVLVILSLVIVGGLVYFFAMGGINQSITNINDLPSNVKLAIPHNGAYSCQVVGTGNPTYTIPTDGVYISKKSIGAYTNQVTGINVFINQNAWDSYFKPYFLGGGLRVAYGYCDADEKGCVLQYKNLALAGKTDLPLRSTSINPLVESFFVVLQKKATLVSSWKNDDSGKATVSYAYTKYGLKYVSTTGNPAGALFGGCESSCDLTCPEQKSRDDSGLIYTTANSLLPTESVPVLEYWEEFNVDLNAEMGSIIYDGNKFCFGGAIYQKGSITLDNGKTYIYPSTATRKNVQCCAGAVISTSTEDKICQSDNTWKVITKDTRIKCVSDFSCPNQGQFTCQNKIKSGWSCNSGFCEKDKDVGVSCCSQYDCPTDQTCQNYKCVGGAITPPVNLTDCTTDSQCGLGSKCINGKCSVIVIGDCKWYQNPTPAKSLFGELIKVDAGCKTAGWFVLTVIIGFLLIILLAIIFVKRLIRRFIRR